MVQTIPIKLAARGSEAELLCFHNVNYPECFIIMFNTYFSPKM